MGDASVDDNKIKGIIGSAGKALAVNGRSKHYVERLESIASPEEFREFLKDAPLGLDGSARQEFIDQVTRDEVWRDRASQLAYSVDVQKADFWDASA